MRRISLRAGVLALLLAGSGAHAQTSLDVIQDDLRTAKEQHDQASSELMTSFLGALDEASQNPAAALDLYKKAGGSMPDAAPVHTRYDYETPTEKAAREAADAQSQQAVGLLLQVHCGLMRNAALLMIDSKKPEVQAQWLDWLKSVAQVYPQLAGQAALKNVTMADSVVGHYLGFHSWGKSEEGKWAVSDVPQFYHDLVLGPLRRAPTQDTLDAWDTYIAMAQADEPDHDKWTEEEEPNLAFERASDDFAIQPSMDKLTTLDDIIKANPSNDHLDDWLTRMRAMLATYRQGGTTHSALPTATPGMPSSDAAGTVPGATPGTTSSQAAGTLPTATPEATPVASGDQVPAATPGTTSSAEPGVLPTATPGTPSAGTGSPVPTASPGTPSAGTGSPVPTASPGSPSSAAPGPLPAATPGTPSSGTTATPGAP